MFTGRVIFTLSMLLVLLVTGYPGYAQGTDSLYPIYAFWRDDTLTAEDISNMRVLRINACLLPAVRVDYDPATLNWSPSEMPLDHLNEDDALGLDFLLVRDIKLWDAGWDGQHPISVLSLI